jgi:peptide/nickel transport system permease protein
MRQDLSNYIFRRLLAIVPVALGVIISVSVLIQLVPGKPVDILLGEYASAAEKSELAHKLGLDLPLSSQIITYLGNLSKGNLGDSLIYNRSVVSLIAERLAPTLELALLAVVFALLISLPLGICSALKKNTMWDFSALFFSLLGVSIPHFWLGPMLIIFFSLKLDLLPVSERGGWASYILPTFTLGTALMAFLSRITRSAFLDVLKEDFVKTARAKGLSEFRVMGKHVLRNAYLPVLTVASLQFSTLLTGAIITESIFDWPGLGSLILEALNQRDYPLIQGCILFFSLSYLLINLATDILYVLFDPRIKLDMKT